MCRLLQGLQAWLNRCLRSRLLDLLVLGFLDNLRSLLRDNLDSPREHLLALAGCLLPWPP